MKVTAAATRTMVSPPRQREAVALTTAEAISMILKIMKEILQRAETGKGRRIESDIGIEIEIGVGIVIGKENKSVIATSGIEIGIEVKGESLPVEDQMIVIAIVFVIETMIGIGTMIETERVAADIDLDLGQRVDLIIDQSLVLAQGQRVSALADLTWHLLVLL